MNSRASFAPPDANRPLSVLLVIEPGRDGAFRFVEQLAYFLLEQHGVTVHLAYSSVRGSPELDTLVETLARRGSQTLDLQIGNSPGVVDVMAFARLRRLARAVQPDVIHAHCSKAGVLARMLVWTGMRARIVYTPHAYYQMYGPTGVKKSFFLAVERLFAHTGITLHTSRSEADYARQKLGVKSDRQRFTRTGVDCERFRPTVDAAEKRALRRRFNLPADACVIGTVARYSEQKDPLTLYRAVVSVLADTPGVHFAHLGKGELMPAVAELLGTVSPDVRARILQIDACDDLPGFYRMLDVFVLASRYEGFALALLEALASGVSLILSECPGNLDLKAYDLDGVQWTTVGDAEQLAARTRASAKRDSHRNNHREITLQVFGGDVGCRDVLSCYESLQGR